MPEALHLDPTALARLRRIGGDRLLGEMIDLFLAHVPERVASAVAAGKAGDWQEVGRAAHSLKSSAGNVGMTAVRELAVALEQRAAADDGAAVAPLLRDLEEAFPRWTALLLEERRKLAR
jgi:HPt (histidine-containing phosphotransfer) domain-containing protein